MNFTETSINFYGINVAFLASHFCQYPLALQAILDALEKPESEGTLWSVLAEAAHVFTGECYAHFTNNKFSWEEAIKDYSDQFLECVLNNGLPTSDSLNRMAWEAIGNNLEDHTFQLSELFTECIPS